MNAWTRRHVDVGYLPGLVTLVSRQGEVHSSATGTLAFGVAAPMQRDTIFRIASMTKPITAVAAMMLVEECKLRLDDPVGILLTQRAPDALVIPQATLDFWTLAYQALDD